MHLLKKILPLFWTVQYIGIKLFINYCIFLLISSEYLLMSFGSLFFLFFFSLSLWVNINFINFLKVPILVSLIFPHCFSVFIDFLQMFIYFEREREQAGKGQREKGENLMQATRCQHRARHGAWTHKPRNYDLSQNQDLVT